MIDQIRTKIIATISLERSTPEYIRKFVEKGVSIFRINSSHSNKDEIRQTIRNIKSAIKDLDFNIGILQDLQGPKIRIGQIENGETEIKDGQTLKITLNPVVGNSEIVSTNYEYFVQDVNIGDNILLDDGKLLCKVISKEKDSVQTEVIHGGILKSKKGINLPQTKLTSPSLTKKDMEDLIAGLEENIDWVALSFVRSADDIIELKKIIDSNKKLTNVIAKIEKPEALENIDGIIEASDALMVARGDLGVEIDLEKVPSVQKKIVAKCNKAGKPVVIATQMMESMIEHPTPTRAEINDIANAVMDHADVLMLSAETAVGKYPFKVIDSMTKAIWDVENNNPKIYDKFQDLNPSSKSFHSDCVVRTACELSKKLRANAIIGSTDSGYTAFEIAKHRPKADIFIFTNNMSLLSTLSMVWGIRAFFYDKRRSSLNNLFEDMEKVLMDKKLLKKGDTIIHAGALPINRFQRANMMKVSVLD